MTEGFTKVKDENENLYIANKKLWSKTRIAGSSVSLGHNEEKVKLPKKSLIIGKHKHPRLRKKLVTGRTSIQSSPKSYRDTAKARYSGKRKLRPKRYSTKNY